MKTELTLKQQLEKSYDYIVDVLCKQRKVLPFDLIYGDGSIHGNLKKEEVKQLYDKMTENITSYYEVKDQIKA